MHLDDNAAYASANMLEYNDFGDRPFYRVRDVVGFDD